MANNTTLRDGNGALFTAESIDVGSGLQRTSTAANLRVGNADVATGNPVPVVVAAGSAVIGKAGIDQTTPGTTNKVYAGDNYASPNSKTIRTVTSVDSLFSDDFGGSAVDTTINWTVLNGGLGANPNLGSGTLTQAAIGSGTTGMTDSVAASALTVAMGTTSGAERWYLSNQVFAGKEDILVVLSKSQALAANSIFVGLVEVDPATLVPLLNPNFAAEFTNRGGLELGLSTVTTAFTAEAIGDSSSAKASGAAGSASAAWTTTQEVLIEIDSRDITVSTAQVDSVAAKAAGSSRVSTQCPNDKKLYKLIMRFRNVSTPASSTSVVVQRIIVVDNYEQRVQVSTGEGDQIGSKAIPANIVNNPVLGTGANTIGAVGLNAGANTIGAIGVNAGTNLIGSAVPSASATVGTAATPLRITTGASGVIKASAGRFYAGRLFNTTASTRYFQLYNKTTAGVPGTDTPLGMIPLPAGGLSTPSLDLGETFSTGIAWAITTDAAGATIGTSGDVVGQVSFI